MPAYVNATEQPRPTLAAVVEQGRGMNKMNIWPQVLPLYGANARTMHLLKKTIADSDVMRILSDKYITQPGADIERITITYGSDTFTVLIRKREMLIPDETEMSASDYFSIEADAMNTGAENLELTAEYLTANAIFNTTNFGSATNSATAYTAANIHSMTPVQDWLDLIDRGNDKGEIVNTFIIPSLVYRRVRVSDDMRGYVKSTTGFSPAQASAITPTVIQDAFAEMGITKVLIGQSRYNTAAQGATPIFTKIWGNQYIWAGNTADSFTGGAGGTAGQQTISGVGANVFWEKYTPAKGWAVETYRAPERESNVVRTKTSIAPYIANPNAGSLLATQFA